MNFTYLSKKKCLRCHGCKPHHGNHQHGKFFCRLPSQCRIWRATTFWCDPIWCSFHCTSIRHHHRTSRRFDPKPRILQCKPSLQKCSEIQPRWGREIGRGSARVSLFLTLQRLAIKCSWGSWDEGWTFIIMGLSSIMSQTFCDKCDKSTIEN